MKETYYFSHDTNARNDEKILCLRADYGILGYGVFWVLVEMMFENPDTQLSYKHIKGIAHNLNIEVELLTNIINSCVEYGLFVSDGNNFWSESLRKRKETYINKRKKKIEAGLKSAEAKKLKILQTSQQIFDLKEPNEDIEQNINSVETEINDVETEINTTSTVLQQCCNSVETEINKIKENKLKEKKIYNSSSSKSEISKEGEEYANFFRTLLPPTQKITNADLKNWAITFDKLVRIDKRPRDEIYQVTEWARKNSFWGEQGNFLSACKLRNKSKDGVLYYDIFLQKFKQENKTNGTNKELQIERPDWIKAKK